MSIFLSVWDGDRRSTGQQDMDLVHVVCMKSNLGTIDCVMERLSLLLNYLLVVL